MEGSDGMFPFYLPLNVRVRIDGTSPHLPPLTERMNEERSHIYTWEQPHEGTRYTTHNTLDIVSFPSSSSCLVFSELTQASERLRLTAARGSDSSLFPSFSGSWRSVFPVLRSLSQSHLNLSRCRFYRLQVTLVLRQG